MGKRKNLSLGLLAAALLVSGCTNNGTEIGNPGSKRLVTGTLAATAPAALTAASLDASTPASCPQGNGDITVVLATAAGNEVATPASETGAFSTQIDQQLRYEIVFRQGVETCAELYYASSDPHAGAHVVIGHGTQDIDVGEITDLGGGIFVSSNDPSTFCDDDGDGVTDESDADADGNGVADTEIGGYIDWYFENEAAETTP